MESISSTIYYVALTFGSYLAILFFQYVCLGPGTGADIGHRSLCLANWLRGSNPRHAVRGRVGPAMIIARSRGPSIAFFSFLSSNKLKPLHLSNSSYFAALLRLPWVRQALQTTSFTTKPCDM